MIAPRTRKKRATRSRSTTPNERRSATTWSEEAIANAAHFDMRAHFLKKENININTVVAIVGFLGVFAGLVTTWTSVQYKQNANEKWQSDHLELHSRLGADAAARYASVTTRLDEYQKQFVLLEEFKYRVAQLEKQQETADTRVSRIVDSYSTQFTEIRQQLANLATQIALANDALSRLERLDRSKLPFETLPKELR